MLSRNEVGIIKEVIDGKEEESEKKKQEKKQEKEISKQRS